MLLLVACGGSGGVDNDGDSLGKIENEVQTRSSVSLIAASLTYEFSDNPQLLMVTAIFEESVKSISTTSLEAVGASVEFLSPLESNKYVFTLRPNGTSSDIFVSIPQDTIVLSSGNLNNSSNQLEIIGVDTTPPEVSLEHSVTEYNSDGSIENLIINVSLTEDILSLNQENFSFSNLQVINFLGVDPRTYQIQFRSAGQDQDILIQVLAGSFSDGAGNQNIASNQINLSSMPLAPVSVTTLNVETALKTLNFSWSSAENATFYRLMSRDSSAIEYTQKGDDILASSELQITLENLSLHLEANLHYQIQSCNSAGCTEGQDVRVIDELIGALGLLKAPKSFDGQAFGSAVEMSKDGNVLAIAAVNDALESDDYSNGIQLDSLYRAGAVYLYRKNVLGSWEFDYFLQAPYRDSSDAFGYSLSLNDDGSVLAVGAYNEDGLLNIPSSNASTNSGAVYVYFYQDSEWVFDKYLKSSDGNSNDLFGSTLDLNADGDLLLVGARGKELGAPLVEGAGKVYVFEHNDISWDEIQILSSPNPGEYFVFGESLAINSDGGVLVVGAPRQEVTYTNEGIVYVYRRNSGQYNIIEELGPTLASSGSIFGAAVDIDDSGETIVVSAPFQDDLLSDSTRAGAVYLYNINNSNEINLIEKLSMPNPVDYTNFGGGIALSGRGDTLVVYSSEYSYQGLDYGFYDESSPNDQRPFSTPANTIYKKNNGIWEFEVFLKSPVGESGALAIDSSGDNIVQGGYSDLYMIDGYDAYGAIDFEAAEKESTVGAVIVY